MKLRLLQRCLGQCSLLLKVCLSAWIVVLGFGLFAPTLLKAAACQMDGSGLVGELPPELGEVLGDAGKGAEICVAPPVKTPPTSEKKAGGRPAFKGPIVAIQGAHIPDEVVILLSGGGAELSQIASDYGLSVVEQRLLPSLGGLAARLRISDGRPVALVRAALQLDPLVLDATANHIYELNEDQSSSGDKGAYRQFPIQLTGLEKAHLSARGRGVKIAIIDTAIDETHPALQGAVVARFNGLEKIPLTETQHGTVVALLAAGSNDGFIGAAPEASLYSARAFDKGADGKFVNSVFAILLSLDWVLREKVDIVNMSFSGPKNKLMGRALANLRARNVLLVAAAGNGGAKAPYSYPGAFDGVFAITAVDAKSRLYGKANQGAYVFAAAPGVDLMVPGADLKVTFKSGTSYGAAFFSGICALALEGLEGRDIGALEKQLIKASEDLGPPGRDPKFGFGLLKASSVVVEKN